MKLFAVIVSLAVAVGSTHAAECTAENIATPQLKSESEKMQSACASALANVQSSNLDKTAAKKLCEEKTCMNTLEAFIKILPDCTVNGIGYKKTFEDQYASMQSECKKLGVSIGASSAASTGLSTAAVMAAAAVLAL